MGSKYRWFDFADSRNLQGDDATVERLGQKQGITGASSPLPGKPAASSGPAAPTNSQVRQANETAVGGKRDKCKKGKSCSATCIFYNDHCLVGLPYELTKDLRMVRDQIQNRVGKGISDDEAGDIFEKHLRVQDELKFGPNVELVKTNAKGELEIHPEFKKNFKDIQKDTKEMNAAIDTIRAKHPPEKADEKIATVIDVMVPTLTPREREKISYTPPEALEYIHKNRATFERMNEIYHELKALQDQGKLTPEIVNERMKEVTKVLKPRQGEFDEDQIRLGAAFMTPYERNFFGTAGALKEGGGLFRAGDQLPSEYGDLSKATAEQQRARVLLGSRNTLESNGKNTYTGQPLKTLESDWEHMIPFEAIKKNAEVMQNIGLVTSRENGGKADRPPSWLYSTEKGGFMDGMKFDSNGKLTPESRQKWEEKEKAKLAVKESKREGFKLAYYERGPQRVQSVKEFLAATLDSKMKPDEKLQVLNKVTLGFLLEHNRKFAETAGGGIQSHGRADKRWYYFGKENPKFARFVVNKILELEEKGESEKVRRIAEIMDQTVNKRLNSAITSELGTNYTYKGKEAFKLGDESTKQVRTIMERLTDEATKEIENL
jgi:hypothetical protein